MIETLIVLGCLYVSYRLFRKPDEKFFMMINHTIISRTTARADVENILHGHY